MTGFIDSRRSLLGVERICRANLNVMRDDNAVWAGFEKLKEEGAVDLGEFPESVVRVGGVVRG
jgi:hypothetical protein